ncbi:hypothetical protein V1264_014632 [Littorina saxatilis]
MPRSHRRESPAQIYDEFDARSYSHLVPQNDKRVPRGQPNYDGGAPINPPTTSRSQKKHKKKKSRKKKDRGEKRQSDNVKSLVAYDDISSDSDLSTPGTHVPVPSRVETDRVSKRPMSPGTEIRSAINNQRGRSNSPGSPVAQTSQNRTSSKSKSKRPRQDRPARSPPDHHRDQSYDSRDMDRHRGRNSSSSRQPPNNSVRNHPPQPPPVPEPVVLPRSFADLPKAYSGRASPPPRQSVPKRYRSRSPSPNYRDTRRENARSRSPLGGSRSNNR